MTLNDPLDVLIPATRRDARRVVIDAISPDAWQLAGELAMHGRAVTALTHAEPPEDQQEMATRHGVHVTRATADPHEDLADAALFVADVFTSPRSAHLAHVREKAIAVSSIADLILRNAPGRTIGITGSAGKTTTTFLLAEILRTAGLTVQASTDDRLTPSGPAHAMLAGLRTTNTDTHHILELTSHHLEHVNVSPATAIVTNLFPDHQDWHGGFDAYRAAKKRILEFQGGNGSAVVNFDDPETHAFGNTARGATLYFSSSDTLPAGVLVAAGMILIRDDNNDEHGICRTDELKLPAHQLGSALAASAAAHLLGVAPTDMATTLRRFTGLPQRRQFIGHIDGVDVYDDTIAMSPRKAAAGLATFGDHSVVVVSGGNLTSPGGEQRVSSALEQADLDRYCRLLTQKAVAAVLYGDGGRTIHERLHGAPENTLQTEVVDDFTTALQQAIVLGRQASRLLIAPVFYNQPDQLKATLDDAMEERG